MSTSKSYGIYRKSRISKYAHSFLRLTDHQIDVAERHGDFEVLKDSLNPQSNKQLKGGITMNILYKTTLITMAVVTWKVAKLK